MRVTGKGDIGFNSIRFVAILFLMLGNTLKKKNLFAVSWGEGKGADS